ncbi:hypothetical protein HPB49_022158 [Dermacentor silvarum]|uniref:Uncharacterized protein n=1 Tax=Dermacentor silvarum TaxID=543639 RepID=A0ACB8E3S4_DERSI|nr:hypothetical protein HPB49_022158 [Dermacentor silvarum]
MAAHACGAHPEVRRDNSSLGPRRKAAGTMALSSRRRRKQSPSAVRAQRHLLETDDSRRKGRIAVAPLSAEDQARHSRYLRPTGPVSHHRSKRKRCNSHPLPSARTSRHSLRWRRLPVPAQASHGLTGRAPLRTAHDHRRRMRLVRAEPERERHRLPEPTGDVARTGLEVVGAQHMDGVQSRPVADDRETFPQPALVSGRPGGLDAYNDFLLHETLTAIVCDEVGACLDAYSSSELRKVVRKTFAELIDPHVSGSSWGKHVSRELTYAEAERWHTSTTR